MMRAAVAAATIVITAGSSLAMTGQLPDAAREFASEAFAVFVPSRERITASPMPMPPTPISRSMRPFGDPSDEGSTEGEVHVDGRR